MADKKDDKKKKQLSLKGHPEFDGSTYDSERDKKRLATQLLEVRTLMLDGKWRTLNEIADATSNPPASISARIRDLRKVKFGAYRVDSRIRGPKKGGLFEYRVTKWEGPVEPDHICTCPNCGRKHRRKNPKQGKLAL